MLNKWGLFWTKTWTLKEMLMRLLSVFCCQRLDLGPRCVNVIFM